MLTVQVVSGSPPLTNSPSSALLSLKCPQVPEHPLNQVRYTLPNVPFIDHGLTSLVFSELSLTDVLTPANLAPLFTSHPTLIPTLFPHLPADLPTPPSPEVLRDITSSPQFRQAVVSLDRALRTGLLGGLVRQLGLPEEAGLGVEAFLRAVAEQGREGDGEGESMDTD